MLYQWQQDTAHDPMLYALTVSPTANNNVYFFRYLLVYVQTFLFALLAVWAMYATCRSLNFSPPAAVFAPIVIILCLPYFQTVGGFFYDYSELAFFSLAAWVSMRQRWLWLIPLAALGTWNKESFFFFIPTLYPFLQQRMVHRTQALLASGALLGVSLAIYGYTRVAFGHNAGATVELWPMEHLRLLLHPRLITIATEETYGVRMLKGFTLLPLMLLAAIALRGWKTLTPAVRSHAKIAAAINVPLYIVFCYPGELRDLSLLFVTLLALLATQLDQWIQSSAAISPAFVVEPSASTESCFSMTRGFRRDIRSSQNEDHSRL
jgi:hypothetical protein